METIQYVNITHTSKDDAKPDFMSTSSECGHARMCTATLPIEAIIELHRRGATLKRVPFANNEMNTNLLYIDIDNDPKVKKDGIWVPDPVNPPPNITEDELKEILWYACAPTRPEEQTNFIDWDYTESTSKIPYKYHIFITLRERVKTLDEYKRIMDEFELRLQAAFMNLRGVTTAPMFHDPNHHPRHCAYAPPTPTVAPIGVFWLVFNEWSPDPNFPRYITVAPRPHLQLTKDRDYYDYTEPGTVLYRDIPPTWSGLARLLYHEGLLEREYLEEPGADFGLASSVYFLRPGKTKDTDKIPVGNRDNQCYITTMALYGQTRAYNLWMDRHGLGEHKFTLEEMKRTLVRLLKRSYADDNHFTHEKFIRILEKMDKDYGEWSDESYVNRFKRKEYKRNAARTRMDIQDATDRIIVSHQNGEVVSFSDSTELKDELEKLKVSINSLRRMVRSKGLVLSVGRSTGSKSGKRGRKAGVTWESLSAIGKPYGSTFEYHGKLTSAQKKFVQRNGLTLKKLRANQGFTSDAEGKHVEPIVAPWKMGTN